MLNDIQSIKNLAGEEIEKTDSLRSIQDLKIKYLGKKGILTGKLKSLGSIPQEDRREYGRILNEAKIYIEGLLGKHEAAFKTLELNRTLQTQRIDVTVPGCYIPSGRLHPTTQILDEIIGKFN